MSRMRERLYGLLPAVYRLRDAEQGEQLRALMSLLERELHAIEADIETTWDNAFIETCEEWIVPYVGEALGVKGVRSLTATGFSLRTFVGDTLKLRRAKGTAAATEQLARGVTGYPARAVELFALTAITTHVNHVREPGALPTRLGTVDLRDPGPLERVNGAFDPFAHRPDIRALDGRVRHNLPNLGLFLWRAGSLEISGSTARPFAGELGWYRFDPRGVDIAAFNLPRSEEDIRALAAPEHVPHPLTRLELDRADPGSDPPIVVRTVVGGVETVLALEVCNLADVAGGLPAHRPPPGTVPPTASIDPELGRIVLHPTEAPPAVAEPFEVLIDYAYAAPGQLGAGPFDRDDLYRKQISADLGSELAADGASPILRQWGVSRSDSAVGAELIFATLEEAVLAWNAWVNGLTADERREAVGLIAITDSRSYTAPATAIELPDGARLYVVAAAWTVTQEDGVPTRHVGDVVVNQVRPHVLGDVEAIGSSSPNATRAGGLFLNGLLVEGEVRAQPGDLEKLDLAHCTVGAIRVDGSAASPNSGLAIRLERTVTGPVESQEEISSLVAADSLIGGEPLALDLGGCAVELTSTTSIGAIRCQTLSASNCILDEGGVAPEDAFDIAQHQQGCLRFSYVPHGARTPRRHRCQPDLALEGVTDPDARSRIVARLRPLYASEVPTDPGFALLSSSGPEELRRASSDGSEPGVWHHLQHALRLANLRATLRQYLRFGLEAGVVLDR